MSDLNTARQGAFNTEMWEARSRSYDKLGWVNAPGPIVKLVEMADIQGGETVIDVGTGGGAILTALFPNIGNGKLIGFDISTDMIGRDQPKDRTLLVADAFKLPFAGNFADVMTARMVFHHLPNIDEPLKEIHRVLKPSGKIIVGEYVAANQEVHAFERVVFDIKEPGRNLWTGDGLKDAIAGAWPSKKVELGYGLMPQYSVKDWMGKSGLPAETQTAVLNQYLNAPKNIIHNMNITFTNEGDALVDRPFAFVSAVK